MSDEQMIWLVTESGIYIGHEECEFLNEGKIVERAQEAKRLWKARDHEGFIKLLSDENFKTWTKEEIELLGYVWFDENVNIYNALDDVEYALCVERGEIVL